MEDPFRRQGGANRGDPIPGGRGLSRGVLPVLAGFCRLLPSGNPFAKRACPALFHKQLARLLGHPKDFVESGLSLEDLVEAIIKHHPHAAGDSGPADVLGCRPLEGKFTDFVV